MAKDLMVHFEREVLDHELICAMLDLMDTVHVAFNDEDGWPYVVPLNFGYEATDEGIVIYTHFMFTGKKVRLMERDDRVCMSFSVFSDFPDCKYKGHYHDFRSVIARGHMRHITYEEDPVAWEKGYNLLYTCNGREIKPLSSRAKVPPMYIGVTACAWEDVTAKSEFPLRSVEDVPFMDMRAQEPDDTPFDISDIVAALKERRERLRAEGWK